MNGRWREIPSRCRSRTPTPKHHRRGRGSGRTGQRRTRHHNDRLTLVVVRRGSWQVDVNDWCGLRVRAARNPGVTAHVPGDFSDADHRAEGPDPRRGSAAAVPAPERRSQVGHRVGAVDRCRKSNQALSRRFGCRSYSWGQEPEPRSWRWRSAPGLRRSEIAALVWDDITPTARAGPAPSSSLRTATVARRGRPHRLRSGPAPGQPPPAGPGRHARPRGRLVALRTPGSGLGTRPPRRRRRRRDII